MELTDIDGVGDGRADSMAEAGYESVEDVATANADELAESVNYLPEDTALEVIVAAGDMVDEERNTEDAESDSEEVEEEDGPMPSELAEASEESADEPDDAADSDDEPEGEESYELVVNLETDEHYDAYMTALFNAYETRVGSNQNALDAISNALDDARYNSGEVTHNLTAYELNTLHASVSQQVTTYKGMNMITHMDAMRDLLAQVNEVRNEKLF